ncbi:MAG TPA: AMP-binding protein, partial [Acidimicrobiia bacterium]|nr:AMP-binding protein [Acidimicrobiia bacterium]
MALISYAQRLRDHAEAEPQRPALTDEVRTVTRAELDRLACRTARALQHEGVRQGDRVTVALPNSVEFVATAIACWKGGATVQPLSSRLPKRELDAIIELAEPRVVLLEPLAVDR